MKNLFKRIRSDRGQTATEYMLIVAVVVLALVAAAAKLVPKFKSGVEVMGGNIEKHLEKDQDPGT